MDQYLCNRFSKSGSLFKCQVSWWFFLHKSGKKCLSSSLIGVNRSPKQIEKEKEFCSQVNTDCIPEIQI